MDAHLKLLADASLETAAAEESIAEAAYHAAAERLDAAASLLVDLRAAWPSMNAGQRAVIGRPAADVRSRMDAARASLPRRSALTVGTPVTDPEQESLDAD